MIKLKESFCWHFLINWKTVDYVPHYIGTELYGWNITVQHKKSKETRTYYSENCP